MTLHAEYFYQAGDKRAFARRVQEMARGLSQEADRARLREFADSLEHEAIALELKARATDPLRK